jgi:hypothetical protein
MEGSQAVVTSFTTTFVQEFYHLPVFGRTRKYLCQYIPDEPNHSNQRLAYSIPAREYFANCSDTEGDGDVIVEAGIAWNVLNETLKEKGKVLRPTFDPKLSARQGFHCFFRWAKKVQ